MFRLKMCLRWGICGTGKISHDFLVGVKTRPETEHKVVAVAARSLESAEKFAATHSIPKSYGSYEEVANDPEVDVVYVGTIHVTHLSTVLKMFERKKPVLCEKPLTMNAQDTATLIEAAKKSDVFLMEAVWMRFFPAIAELRKQIREGAIGDVMYVSASIGARRLDMDRLNDPKLGGGSVLDMGIYPINFATMVFGGEKPESIHASGWLGPTGVDQCAVITLKYPGERVAQLLCGFCLEPTKEAVVIGTKGTLKLPAHFWCPTKLETPSGVLEFPLVPGYLPTNYTNSEGLGYEAEAVRNCLQEGKKESDVMPLSQTQLVAEIMDSVMKQLGVVYYKQ